ncbi:MULTISPECIES: DUF1801 domain-containing protein [unclassified Brevibacterium]|uniref:DUF1801 domain-containing protein n=1 Tax=unclassified Brevibacterium TaxID=2614124 RepID=UPI001091AE4A|nr:DUF1801 domain-containing protein [Brevibacterium sp. S22]TGD32255.1 DUF1801 domain-containing protein [Brevibacterium sp. S22]
MAQRTPAMRPTGEPVVDALDRAQGPRRAEAEELCALFGAVSGEQPVVWASRIIGFGEVAYTYESGHSGIVPVLAFSPAARQHTIYLTSDFEDHWPDLMARLGSYRSSTACLYLTRLKNIDRGVLRELLVRTRDHTLAEWSDCD